MNIVVKLLDTMFGIDPKRVDLSDDLRDDWGIDKFERNRFEREFRRIVKKPVSTFAACRTVEDFSRLVG